VRRGLIRHALFGVTVVGAVVGVAGSLHSGALPGNGANWSNGVVAIGFAWLGWLVAGRRPELAIGWLFLAGGVASAAAFTANWWAAQSLLGDSASLPGGPFAAWAAVWLDAVRTPLVLVIPLVLFPAGRPRSPRWRWFLWMLCGAIALLTLYSLVTAIPAATGPRPVSLLDVPGLHESGWGGAAIGASAVARLLALLGGVVGLVGLGWARRRETGAVRRAHTTVLLGALAFVVVWVAGALVEPLTAQRHQAPEEIYAIAALCVPAAIGVAIARFRLYDVRGAVSRSVLVVGIGAALCAVYLVVLASVAAVVDDSRVLTIPSVLAAGVVVLASAPIASATRRLTRGWFGRGAATGVVADRFNVRLRVDSAASEQLRVLAETLQEELRLGSVELTVRGMEGCVVGYADPPLVTVPLGYAQHMVGEMVVSARPGETLAGTDKRLLADLARYAAVAVEAIRTSEDLRHAQHALDTAHAEERRRVRRDLHDGVAPALASVRLNLTAIRRANGDHALDGVIDQVADTIREIRRIVDGLQPSVLEDLGLLPALAILVADVRQASAINVVVEAPLSLPELPAVAVNTAYRVVSEALANVMRHSQALSCHVRVDHQDGVLEIEVRDDGCGFDPGVRSGGMGLRSIATRASLASGSAIVATAPGTGTTVTLQVPA
jgi:signal transduction histidine kinase